MLDLLLLFIFLAGIGVGLRRGLILQLIHFTGFFVAFIAAYMFYDELAPKFELWIPFPASTDSSFNMLFDLFGLENAFYNAIAFVIIFFAAKIIWQIFGSMLDFIAQFPILKQLNRWGGGIFGFLEIYLITFILLYIAALLPIQSVQESIQGSFVAETMVKHTPILSTSIKDLWFTYMSI
ncbi:MAG: CvpA family protein [Bacillus sp. (in: firmicutes)]